MQAVATMPQDPPRTITVTLETVAYLVLILLSFTFRLAELDAVPMTVPEAPNAVAAWRSIAPYADAVAPASPAVFWAQKIGFSLLGATEFAARVITALAGVALTLSPLLFRPLLGRTRTFAFVLLLTFSPVLLLASRFSSGTIWALLFGVLSLWAVWRFISTQENGYGAAAIVFFALTLFFSEPGGILLGFILLTAGLAALTFSAADVAADDTRETPISTYQARLRELPFIQGVLLSAVVLIVLSTGFLTFIDGLNGVGALLTAFVGGFGGRLADAPAQYPLWVTFFYEPILWGFAIVGIVLLVRRGVLDFVERFFIAWLVFAALAVLIYAGAQADYALWFTVPLAGLAAYTIASLFGVDDKQTMFSEMLDIDDEDIARLYTPMWGKWLLALIALGLFTMLALHLQIVGRAFLTVDGGTLDGLFQRLSLVEGNDARISLLWTVITLVFFVVGFFLAASVWGSTTTLQAFGLGLLGFMLINGLSGGWSAAVSDARNPAEVWHVRGATDGEIPRLRSMLLDFSEREFSGYPELPVTLVLNDELGVTRDGVVAWQLRDFANVRFVDDIDAARADQIVIIPTYLTDPPRLPDLGGSYVGRTFVVLRDWDINELQGFDWLAWWFRRDTRVNPYPLQVVSLWVRQDIFNSQPFTPQR